MALQVHSQHHTWFRVGSVIVLVLQYQLLLLTMPLPCCDCRVLKKEDSLLISKWRLKEIRRRQVHKHHRVEDLSTPSLSKSQPLQHSKHARSSNKYRAAQSTEEQEAVLLEYIFYRLLQALHISIRVVSDAIRIVGDTVAGFASGVVKVCGGVLQLFSGTLAYLSSYLEAQQQQDDWLPPVLHHAGQKYASALRRSAVVLKGAGDTCVWSGEILEALTGGLGEALQDSFRPLEALPLSAMRAMDGLLLREYNTSQRLLLQHQLQLQHQLEDHLQHQLQRVDSVHRINNRNGTTATAAQYSHHDNRYAAHHISSCSSSSGCANDSVVSHRIIADSVAFGNQKSTDMRLHIGRSRSSSNSSSSSSSLLPSSSQSSTGFKSLLAEHRSDYLLDANISASSAGRETTEASTATTAASESNGDINSAAVDCTEHPDQKSQTARESFEGSTASSNEEHGRHEGNSNCSETDNISTDNSTSSEGNSSYSSGNNSERSHSGGSSGEEEPRRSVVSAHLRMLRVWLQHMRTDVERSLQLAQSLTTTAVDAVMWLATPLAEILQEQREIQKDIPSLGKYFIVSVVVTAVLAVALVITPVTVGSSTSRQSQYWNCCLALLFRPLIFFLALFVLWGVFMLDESLNQNYLIERTRLQTARVMLEERAGRKAQLLREAVLWDTSDAASAGNNNSSTVGGSGAMDDVERWIEAMERSHHDGKLRFDGSASSSGSSSKDGTDTTAGGGFEDAVWLNSMLLALWETLDSQQELGGLGPYISDMYATMVNAELAKVPPAVASIRLKSLDLGNSPPLLRGVWVHSLRNSSCFAEQLRKADAVAFIPTAAADESDNSESADDSSTESTFEPWEYRNVPNSNSSNNNSSSDTNSSSSGSNSSSDWSEPLAPWNYLKKLIPTSSSPAEFSRDYREFDRQRSKAIKQLWHYFTGQIATGAATATHPDSNTAQRRTAAAVEAAASSASAATSATASDAAAAAVEGSSGWGFRIPSGGSFRSQLYQLDRLKFLKHFSTECDRLQLELDVVFVSRGMDIVLSLRPQDVKQSVLPEATVTVSSIRLAGKLRLNTTLTNDYPFIGTAEFSFTEPPQLGFSISGFGGVELGSVPLAYYFVNSTMHWILQQFISPNQVSLDLRHTICPDCDTPPPPTAAEQLLQLLLDAQRALLELPAAVGGKVSALVLRLQRSVRSMKASLRSALRSVVARFERETQFLRTAGDEASEATSTSAATVNNSTANHSSNKGSEHSRAARSTLDAAADDDDNNGSSSGSNGNSKSRSVFIDWYGGVIAAMEAKARRVVSVTL